MKIELSEQEKRMFDSRMNCIIENKLYFFSTTEMGRIGDFTVNKDHNGFIYLSHKNKNINRYLSKEISHIFGLKVHEDWDLGSKMSDWGYTDQEYQYLLERNPQLKILDRYFPEKKKDIFYGAISLFNFQDIWYFCKYKYSERPHYISELALELEIKLGIDFPWVTSWNTLKKIQKHYEEGNVIDFEKLKTFKYRF